MHSRLQAARRGGSLCSGHGVAFLCLTLVAACAPEATDSTSGHGAAAPAAGGDEIPATIRAAVDDPLRPEEDRERDADRKPAEVLAFFGIAPGMDVLDLQSTRGYYTEILSSLVGPDGVVYTQNNAFVLERFAEEPLADRLQRLEAAGRDNIRRVDAELDEMELPADLDAVIFIRFYHDLFWLPTPDGNLTDRAEFLRRVYAALKPGGVFGVVDHHAEADSGDRDAVDRTEGLHRIDAALVRGEVETAGFVLDAESDLLANPEDTRDWNIFVDNGARRDKTDRFVYRFVKPAD